MSTWKMEPNVLFFSFCQVIKDNTTSGWRPYRCKPQANLKKSTIFKNVHLEFKFIKGLYYTIHQATNCLSLPSLMTVPWLNLWYCFAKHWQTLNKIISCIIIILVQNIVLEMGISWLDSVYITNRFHLLNK